MRLTKNCRVRIADHKYQRRRNGPRRGPYNRAHSFGKVVFRLAAMCLSARTLLAAPAPSTQPAAVSELPTTSPTTRPSVGVIRGRVLAAMGWDLQKPDTTRAVVYLAADPLLDAVAEPLPKAVMGQKDKTFVPSFIVVPRGTEVEFPNWDHISHNVFSRSKAAPAFDLDRYPFGYSKTRTFDKVGVVQVFCNIHQQMRAVIVVTPNAFFARPDADGRFELKDVPQGRHELVIWHERCEEQRRIVDVSGGSIPELAFDLVESRRGAIASNPSKDPGGYGVERGLGVKRERLDLPVVTDVHPTSAPAPDSH